MRVIRDAGARAVFLGDTKQTKAVEAGKPFEQLIKAGMETAYMKDIQRQKDPELLKAALNAAEGKIKASLTHVTSIVEEKIMISATAALSGITWQCRRQTGLTP